MAQPVERNGTVEVDGRQLAWRRVGEGPPLVLINGYSATSMGWDPQFVATLARFSAMICPDNRGIGGSELGVLEEPLTIDSMAADVEALLAALEIERLPVAGWSMGGFVAQALAARAPDRVEALVLLSTNPGGADAVAAEPAALAQLTDHSGTPREQATRLLALLFPAGVAEEMDEKAGDLVAAARAELSPAALQAQQDALIAWGATEPPPGTDPPPVLAACGDEDRVIPPANLERLAARWPNCRVERFAGAATPSWRRSRSGSPM